MRVKSEYYKKLGDQIQASTLWFRLQQPRTVASNHQQPSFVVPKEKGKGRGTAEALTNFSSSSKGPAWLSLTEVKDYFCSLSISYKGSIFISSPPPPTPLSLSYCFLIIQLIGLLSNLTVWELLGLNTFSGSVFFFLNLEVMDSLSKFCGVNLIRIIVELPGIGLGVMFDRSSFNLIEMFNCWIRKLELSVALSYKLASFPIFPPLRCC